MICSQQKKTLILFCSNKTQTGMNCNDINWARVESFIWKLMPRVSKLLEMDFDFSRNAQKKYRNHVTFHAWLDFCYKISIFNFILHLSGFPENLLSRSSVVAGNWTYFGVFFTLQCILFYNFLNADIIWATIKLENFVVINLM